MLGLNLWKTERSILNFGELTEEQLLDEEKKADTFPLGTIKKYGEKHLYVKVGGKKPWVYYATLGTEKSDAAISAGGCVVVDGKAVAPATKEQLAKHGQKHPHEGGTPPPIEMPAAQPKTGPGAAGGVISAPAVAPPPKAPVPDDSEAAALAAKAQALSATAQTPEDHGAAVQAHIAAHNAFIAIGDTKTASTHEAAMFVHIEAKKKALASTVWAGFPNPSAAAVSVAQLVKVMDAGGADAAKAAGLQHTYGSGFEKFYQLAKSVQNMSMQATGTPDPEGLIKQADKHPTMAQKLFQLYGPDWPEQAKAIGLALAAAGTLQPAPPAPPPPPPKPPTPTVQALAGKMLAGSSLDTLEKIVSVHPELKDKLEKLTGMNYKDAAFIAMQMASAGVANTLIGYKDLPPDHVVLKAVKALAGEMGISMPPPPLPAPPPSVPSVGGPVLSPGALKGFVQDLKDIPLDAANKGNQLGQVAYKINKTVLNQNAFAGYSNPSGSAASPTEVLAVAHALVHTSIAKATQDYGHLMTADGIMKLWNILGQPSTGGVASISAPSIAPTPSPAPPPPTSTPVPTSYYLAVHVPKKGQVYQAIKKLGYDLASDEAKTVTLLHAFGDYDKVLAKLKENGLTDNEAEKLLNKVVQDGPKAGAFDWDANQGFPTFKEKAKKPKAAGALAAYADEIKNATIGGLQDIVLKIEKEHPGFFANYVDNDGHPVVPSVVLHAAGMISQFGLKKATAKNSVVSAASMKKIADKLKPAEAGDVPSTPTSSGSVALPSLAPPPPSAVPSALPAMSDLKLKGDAKHLGGAGQKAIYVDKQGKEYLFKVAKSKSGDKVEPYRAEVQAAFSAFARKIKPNHPPIGVVTMGGQLGTIYPFVAAKGNLAGASPTSLTDTEKYDVATEHVLDWLGSQHDSHGANLLRTDDGRVVGLDKEQGFKYFPDDKLDVDYHPNVKYGENEPFYNKFWREWSEGKFDFDPKALTDVIQKATAVSGKEYGDIMTPYAAARFPGNKVRQAQFIRRVVNRKNTLRRDYEKFLSKLHEKREGEPGTYTFAGGWTPKSKEAQPYEQTSIVTPEKQVPEQTHTAESLLNTLSGTSKTAPYTPKGSTDVDPSKITVKTSAGPEALKGILKKMGFGDVDTKTGGHYTMAFVDKTKWDAFHETIPAYTVPAVTKTETIYPGKSLPPHSGQATYLPAMRASEPTSGNVEVLKKITKTTPLKLGSRITLDGPAVEQQVARVMRKKDAQGEYYEVHFKLRLPTLKKITGGASTNYEYPRGTYDEKTDTMVDSQLGNNSVTAKKFTTTDGEAYVVPPGGGAFAMQGSVYARVRGGPENIHKALSEMLDKMHPGLAKDVLRDPTPEEKQIVSLSAALQAVAPQVADQLDKEEASGKTKRTSETVLNKLKGYMSEEDIASLGQVEILPNHAGVVLPGRWRRLGGTKDLSDPNVRFLMWEVSTPDKVVNMFKGNGPACIHDRALQGLSIQESEGASIGRDIRTGCADNITMRVVTKKEDGKELGQGWGDIRLIFAPDELDRLDPFFHFGDQYGCTNPDDSSYGSAFKQRHALDQDIATQMHGHQTGELVVRRGIPTDKIVRISCASESMRKSVVDKLKAEGMAELNGVPIEDFVVVAKTRGEMYEKYVKPAGF